VREATLQLKTEARIWTRSRWGHLSVLFPSQRQISFSVYFYVLRLSFGHSFPRVSLLWYRLLLSCGFCCGFLLFNRAGLSSGLGTVMSPLPYCVQRMTSDLRPQLLKAFPCPPSLDPQASSLWYSWLLEQEEATDQRQGARKKGHQTRISF